MADFFLGVPDRLELFGGLHIAISVIFLLIAALLFCFGKKLRGYGNKRAVRIAMASLLALNMILHYGSRIVLGIWSVEGDLPLHICYVTNFAMIYILLTDNKNDLYKYFYYFTYIGPLPAIIWPDLDYSWQSYIFWHFIISHHIMLLISLYSLIVLEYKVNLKSMLPAFVVGNLYIAAVAGLNQLLGTNYIMITELPDQLYEIYPFLELLPPIFWLELVGALAMLLAYLPAYIHNRKRRREQA
ncbi:MAG: TIGR02206 family membrane protein [Oscillospiraceae bacterium]